MIEIYKFQMYGNSDSDEEGGFEGLVAFRFHELQNEKRTRNCFLKWKETVKEDLDLLLLAKNER